MPPLAVVLPVAGHLAGGDGTEAGGRDPAGGEDPAGGATGGEDAGGCIVTAEVLEAAAFLVILPDLLRFAMNSWVWFSQVSEALLACGAAVARDPVWGILNSNLGIVVGEVCRC